MARTALGSIGFLVLGLFAWSALGQQAASLGGITARPLPEALFAAEPAARVAGISEVERAGLTQAADKLASLAEYDAYPEVRVAACRALATLGLVDRVPLLEELARRDANAEVRAAAARAARQLSGAPAEEPRPFLPESQVSAGIAPEAGAETGDERYRGPRVKAAEPEPVTKHFAIGIGTMGGYGIAALDLRLRFPPWIGVELGGGWSPPGGFMLISGMQTSVTERRWTLISGAAALLIYPARIHYIPVRFGFDPGQGPYGLLGYGFEGLNDEGFFSWGAEVGVLVHPFANEWMKNVTDCEERDACNSSEEGAWVVIPFVRFSLHFYLV